MLFKTLLLLISLGVTGCSMVTSASTTQNTALVKPSDQRLSLNYKKMMNLNSYQWKNRLLLVFAPSENTPNYQQQMQLFQGQQASFDERKLLVIKVVTGADSDVDAAKIRQQFNISPEEFSVVLVGKDGTAKRRDNSPVSPQAIFETIDAMPMRQQEMRQG